MSKDQKIQLARILSVAVCVIAILSFLIVQIDKVSAVEVSLAVTSTELNEYKKTQAEVFKQILEKLDDLIALHPRQ